jgi:hypothetical protein
MVANYNYEKINNILKTFKNIELTNTDVNLVDLALLMKEQNKTPAIIFQKNTLACLRIVRDFAKTIDEKENKKYPKLLSQRIKDMKKAKRIEKIKDKTEKVSKDLSKKLDGDMSKKEIKKMLDEKYVDPMEGINIIGLQEPTSEFNLNPEQYFTEGNVEEWVRDLKKYFPCTGQEYHFIIKLLWRGVGVYAKGLPDPYLRLVQSLATKKQLAIVFSDIQLVFGVSMPFRTVVIYRDAIVEDDLDGMLYHQMAGRAGRRGLDKEGNVIFAGYGWKRIEELSICPIPNIIGTNTLNMVFPHANKLSIMTGSHQNWEKIFINSLNGDTDEDNNEMLEGIKSNYDNGWDFAMSTDKNHLHMMWVLRNSEEPIITSFILPYFKKAFESMDPIIEGNQIMLANFLSHFIHTKETDIDEHILPKCSILEQPSFAKIYDYLEELQLDIPGNIDGRIFISIKNNLLVPTTTEKNADELRQRLFDFGNKLIAIQHMCFHSKMINLATLLGKLLTRIWWIYHLSSPIMKPFSEFDIYDYEIDE